MAMDDSANPQDLCTWRPTTQCAGCSIEGQLHCRFNWSDLLYFGITFLPPALAGVAGMIRAGFGWYTLAWLGFALFFFNVWEARVLCSHCPYYAEVGPTLRCIANYGSLKLWPYQPGPMNRSEQVQFLVGAGLLIGFPFPFMLLGGTFLLALIAAAGTASFVFGISKQVCTRCVNFSCPLNRVPKPVVDAYLRRNPVMRRAWEASGYSLD